jgi:hypothetical protein
MAVLEPAGVIIRTQRVAGRWVGRLFGINRNHVAFLGLCHRLLTVCKAARARSMRRPGLPGAVPGNLETYRAAFAKDNSKQRVRRMM